jgi:drug/metabolite transporter (DMT)-like permease
MSHASTTPAPAETRRDGLVQWTVIGLIGAALIIVFGNTRVDHANGENGGLGPALVTGVGCLVLAAVLFGWAVAKYKGTRAQIVLAVLSVLSLAVFWSGAPAVFGAATASIGRRENGSFSVPAWIGLAAGLIAIVVTFVSWLNS